MSISCTINFTLKMLIDCLSYVLISSVSNLGEMHLTAYSHRCEVCNMTFQKKEALTNHSRTHQTSDQHKCHVCEKTFPNEKVRDQHAAKHKGQLPHKCETCQMSFQVWSLTTFFIFNSLFLYSFICLKGKPMAPHWGVNTVKCTSISCKK